MESEEGGRNATPAQPEAVTEGVAPGPRPEAADAAAAAGLAEAAWRRIDTALSPIIGPLGMNALFKRSLYLARDGEPCFASVQTDAPGADPYARLRDALATQTGPAAVQAQAALLRTFRDLLSSLIGASLTERLLRSAAAFPSSGDAAQDSTP